MDTTSNTNGGASDAPVTNQVPAATLVARGSIADYLGFKAKVSAEVLRLAARRRAWASEESVALFKFIFDEYYAQLEDRPYDVDDLTEVIARYVNQNAVSNRLADAKHIDRTEKKSKVAGSDLI